MNFKNVKRAAEEQGFVVTRTAKGHWKFLPPDPGMPIVYASGTPSDYRALQNLVSRLRRSGLVWNGR